MTEIVMIMLKLPDGNFVMQRRDNHAPTSANLLGFFGGHIDNGETPIAAINRELSEETSLDVSGLKIKRVTSQDIPSPKDSSVINLRAHLFISEIPDTGFGVHEGSGKEIYSLKELFVRDDLTYTASYLLSKSALV